MVANKQYDEGLKEKVGNVFPEAFVEKYKERSLKNVRGPIQTQINLEINGIQKNRGRAKHSSAKHRQVNESVAKQSKTDRCKDCTVKQHTVSQCTASKAKHS